MLLGCAGCAGGQATPHTDAGGDTEPLAEAERQAEIDRRKAARPGFGATPPERVPETADDGVTGEVPGRLLEEIRNDLATRLDAGDANITVIIAEAVTWNDGSLGCPQPGRLYTQAIVPGYRVVLELAGQRYTYHADAGGYFMPCDRQLMLPPPGTTPAG